jgi:hypothetical protein
MFDLGLGGTSETNQVVLLGRMGLSITPLILECTPGQHYWEAESLRLLLRLENAMLKLRFWTLNNLGYWSGACYGYILRSGAFGLSHNSSQNLLLGSP